MKCGSGRKEIYHEILHLFSEERKTRHQGRIKENIYSVLFETGPLTRLQANKDPKEDKNKAVFTLALLGHYGCDRIAFGLTNSLASFQRINVIYLDDSIMYCSIFEQCS